MGKNGTAKIIFQPSGRRGEVEKGINIIEASRQIGVDIETLCGEKMVCGKCKVELRKAPLKNSGLSQTRDLEGYSMRKKASLLPLIRKRPATV